MKRNFKIRKVTAKDISAIVKLHKKIVTKTNGLYYNRDVIKEWLAQITSENVAQQLRVKSTLWYVLEANNKIIGFCQFSLTKEVIYQLNIDTEFQGKGFGKMLYEFMEKRFRKSEATEIELNATNNARTFYEKLGFKTIKQIQFRQANTQVKMFEMKKSLIYAKETI
jgi:putative acetyltransferase